MSSAPPSSSLHHAEAIYNLLRVARHEAVVTTHSCPVWQAAVTLAVSYQTCITDSARVLQVPQCMVPFAHQIRINTHRSPPWRAAATS